MAVRNALVLTNGQLWELPAGDTLNGSGPSASLLVTTLTANATPTAATQVLLANTAGGTFTITLPTAVGNSGIFYRVKLIAAIAVTIATTSAQTIDGSATIPLARIYSSLTIISNGTNWFVL